MPHIDAAIRERTREIGTKVLKKARFDWAPQAGTPHAQGMMVLALLHALIGAIRGLAALGERGAGVEELWQIVRERGDHLVTDGEGEIETLRVLDA